MKRITIIAVVVAALMLVGTAAGKKPAPPTTTTTTTTTTTPAPAPAPTVTVDPKSGPRISYPEGPLLDKNVQMYMDEPGGGGGASCGAAYVGDHLANSGWGLTGGYGWDGIVYWCWDANGNTTHFDLRAWPYESGWDQIEYFWSEGNTVAVCVAFNVLGIGRMWSGCSTWTVYAYPGFVVTV